MTGLTYRNRDEERDDRQQEERLLVALDAAPSQLGRDECGWWTISGRAGAIPCQASASWTCPANPAALTFR